MIVQKLIVIYFLLSIHTGTTSSKPNSNSESGHPRLNSTSIENELVFNDNDLSNTRNNLSHQSQQIISDDFPEDYIESPMWVGTGTRLQARKLPANSDQEVIISNKLETLCLKISNCRLPLTMIQLLLMVLILITVY